MAITLVGVAEVEGNQTTTLTLTHGLTILEDDQIWFGLNADGNISNRTGTPTVTAVIRDVDELSGHTWSARRTATASEPDDYVWTFSSGERCNGFIHVYRGVDTTSPLDSSNVNINTSPNLTGTFSNLTPTVDGCAVVAWIAAQEGNQSSTDSFNTWFSPVTERLDISTTGAGSGAKSAGSADVIQTTAVEIGGTVNINHADTTNWGCFLFAFAPAAGGGNTLTAAQTEASESQSVSTQVLVDLTPIQTEAVEAQAVNVEVLIDLVATQTELTDSQVANLELLVNLLAAQTELIESQAVSLEVLEAPINLTIAQNEAAEINAVAVQVLLSILGVQTELSESQSVLTRRPEYFILSPSTNIAVSGEPTTARLVAPTGKSAGADFEAGRIQDDENPADTIDLGLSKYTEYEWSIEATAAVVNGTTYNFRITINGVPIATYTVTPQWTIDAGGDFTLTIAQTEAGDVNAAQVEVLINLTSAQTELSENQTVNLEVLIQLLLAQNEAGEIQSVTLEALIELVAAQNELSESQIASLLNIASLVATQTEYGPLPANLVTNPEDFSLWFPVGTPPITVNTDVAPDGNTTADTVGDDDGAAFEIIIAAISSYSVGNTYIFSISVKKDAIGRATRFPAFFLQFSGSTEENNSITLDTNTGEFFFAGDDPNVRAAAYSEDTNYWRVWITAKSQDVLNTAGTVYIFPAVGADINWAGDPTATGDIVIWGARVDEGTVLYHYDPLKMESQINSLQALIGLLAAQTELTENQVISLEALIQLTMSQTELVESQAISLEVLVELILSQNESSEAQLANLDLLVQLLASQNELIENQSVSLQVLDARTLTIAQVELTESQVVNLEGLIKLTIVQVENSETQAVTTRVLLQLTGAQVEGGDSQSISLEVILKLTMAQTEIGEVDVGIDLSDSSEQFFSVDKPFGITTLTSLMMKPDGSKLYLIDAADFDTIEQWSLTTPWDPATLVDDMDPLSDIGLPLIATPADMQWNGDGTKFFLLSGTVSDAFGEYRTYQFTCTTAYDISTGSYDSIFGDLDNQDANRPGPLGFCWGDNGNKIFYIRPDNTPNNHLRRLWGYDVGSPYDITDLTADGNGNILVGDTTGLGGGSKDPRIADDGGAIYIAYVAGIGDPVLQRLELATPYDLSSVVGGTDKEPDYAPHPDLVALDPGLNSIDIWALNTVNENEFLALGTGTNVLDLINYKIGVNFIPADLVNVGILVISILTVAQNEASESQIVLIPEPVLLNISQLELTESQAASLTNLVSLTGAQNELSESQITALDVLLNLVLSQVELTENQLLLVRAAVAGRWGELSIISTLWTEGPGISGGWIEDSTIVNAWGKDSKISKVWIEDELPPPTPWSEL